MWEILNFYVRYHNLPGTNHIKIVESNCSVVKFLDAVVKFFLHNFVIFPRCISNVVFTTIFTKLVLQVDAAAAAHPWLESGPLLPSPWYGSQFLSHALRELEAKEEGFSYMAEYMNATEELGEYAQGFGNLFIEFLRELVRNR